VADGCQGADQRSRTRAVETPGTTRRTRAPGQSLTGTGTVLWMHKTRTTSSRRTRALIATFTAVCALSATGSAQAAPAKPAASYIIVLNPAADMAGARRNIEGLGGSVRFEYQHALRGFAAMLNESAVQALSKNPNVLRVEADGVATIKGSQTTPPWGLDRIDQRNLPLDSSFTWTGAGAGVSMYIIDTGVRADHTQFTGRILPGYTSISDGNGTSDCNGHGTHVAGTAAGSTYGIARESLITPVRVLDCAGSGSWSGVIAGIDWMVANHAAGVPAVANMSLGGGANTSVDDAVKRAIADGIVMSIAAGNSNVDACTTTPARVPGALTIAASGNTDTRASFSNYGSCVDMFAPGVSILSAWNTGTSATNSISGTSMAAPHVAGSVAASWSVTLGATSSDLVNRILAGTTPNVIASAGTGTPNRLLWSNPAFTAAPATAPSAPSKVVATAASKSAKLTWNLNGNGGSTLTSNTVNVYTGTGVLHRSVQVAGTATSATISSLVSKSSYYFTVVSTNSVGRSAESAKSNTITVR
jgi:subtilisin family serine protease